MCHKTMLVVGLVMFAEMVHRVDCAHRVSRSRVLGATVGTELIISGS